jgi:homoserine dehydrogenase
MAQKKLTIGLFGFGVVGEGIYNVLLQTPTLNGVVKKIGIKHPDKKRNAPAELFTTHAEDILQDEEINLIIELIDNADEAFSIVSTALKNGKHVVTANKKLVAEHLPELLELRKQTGVSLLYEAAVCGAIPILRNLEEYYDNDLLQSVTGIVNGSTNYILTKIIDEGLTYTDALRKAQELGFAESNPSLDVEGIDAVNKLSILLTHAYGVVAHPNSLLRIGINRLNSADADYAREKGYKIKLTAQALKLSNGKIAAFVLPQFVQADHLLYSVKNEYNGVIIESKLADKQFLYGKGAGRYPTASAVASDISALSYDYHYEYKKLQRTEQNQLSNQYFLKVFVSFNSWADVNKWDFEQVSAFHSTEERQYITGIISVEKLVNATWLHDNAVSLLLLPDAIVEKEALVTQTLKKVSLQLAGIQ